MTDTVSPVTVVSGSNDEIRRRQVRTSIDAALEAAGIVPADRTFAVESFDSEEYTADELVSSALTESFLAPQRIVVARNIERLAAELDSLVEYFNAPSPTNFMVLEWAGRAPAAFTKRLTSNVVHVATTAPRNDRDRADVLTSRLAASGLRLDADARRLITQRLGEDLGPLDTLCDLLVGTFAGAEVVRASDVEPLLAQSGPISMFAFTDAIDDGRPRDAILTLHRMLNNGFAPLQVAALLRGRYERALRAKFANPAQTMPDAKAGSIKAAQRLANRLGNRLGTALDIVSAVPPDLRGRGGLAPQLVLEVAIGRLSYLTRT